MKKYVDRCEIEKVTEELKNNGKTVVAIQLVELVDLHKKSALDTFCLYIR